MSCFLNADPIGFEGGLNWYAYAGNNPILYIDPSGLIFGTGLSAGEFFGAAASGAGMGAMAFVDGAVDIIPFVDAKPFERMGAYDSSQYGLDWSQTIGSATRDVASIISGGGGIAVATRMSGRAPTMVDRTIAGIAGTPSAVSVLTGNISRPALAIDAAISWSGRLETFRQAYNLATPNQEATYGQGGLQSIGNIQQGGLSGSNVNSIK